MKRIFSKTMIWLLVFSFIIDATPVWALTKEENIYTKLNSDGSVNNTYVYEHLYGFDNNIVKDKSSLNNIENVSGKEKYSKDNEDLTWEANGNDIYYTGTTNKDLPISMSIKYYLNGKEYKANDILGKKGKVKIIIKYENHLKKQVIVNGKIETLYTPFVIATTSLLPNDNNTNIEVTNGKVINNGMTSIVVGISSPGLYESLNLEEIKDLDTIEITYDTKSFELSSMYAVATSKLIGDEDLDILNNIKKLYSGIDALQSNMDLLVDGSRKLADGTNEFNNAIQEIGDKYHYYRNINKEDIINMLRPVVNNAIQNTIPALKNKAKETIDYAINNIEPEMVEAIAAAAANSTKDVIEGEINRILSEIDIGEYITNIVGQDLIEALTTDEEVRELTINIINAIGEAYSNEIEIITDDALDDLINSISVNMSSSDRQAYIEGIAQSYNISYEDAEAIVNKVQTDTINGIKNNIDKHAEDISMSIASKVINNITSSDHINAIVNEYVSAANNIIAEVMSNETIQGYKEQLKTNIASYIKEELAKKDLIERYVESSEYVKDIVNQIIDETADELSDSYFTNMTADTIKDMINNELNKYSIKDELDRIINEANNKLNILDEKVDLLTSSVAMINNGANQLADGLEMYNEQGIKKISGLVNGDVKSLTGKIEALTKLSKEYKTLDDINNTDNGKSKIIFMVDSLKKVEDKKITTEKIVEKETIWDKIKGLFK